MWPPISNIIKMLLIEYGPIQGQDADFRVSILHDGRKFSKDESLGEKKV